MSATSTLDGTMEQCSLLLGLYRGNTLRVHQSIPTNATVSKVSDITLQ